LERSMQVVFEFNPELKAKLGPRFAEETADIAQMLETLEREFLQARAPRISAEAWRELASRAVNDMFEFGDQIAPERRKLIEGRVADLKREQAETLGVASLCALLALAWAGLLGRRLLGSIREREAQRRELRLVLDAMPAMIAYADRDERIQYHNLAFAGHHGASENELVGKTMIELLGPERHATTKAYRDRALAGEALAYERRQAHADGRNVDLSVAMVPNRGADGAVAGYYTMMVDVTELKRVESMKSEFVSVVSHELRTPLTSIKGALGLLAGPMSGQLPQAARSLSEVALDSCNRLARLIDDLLDMDKIISGKMQLSLAAVDLALVAAQAIERNQTFALSRAVRLDLLVAETRARVTGDADRLHQVFANLITNAVKHSPKGGVVDIAVAKRITAAGERIRITVRDRGRGVPADFKPRLFGKFAQAESVLKRTIGGSGLGLAISKAIVEQHGGSIGHDDADPADGGGAIFWFELPLN
jgi:PAS domain S-box-containing protein